MRKRAVVWRESIYKNGFRCRCGTVLLEGEKLTKSTEIDPDGFVRCRNCDYSAGVLADVEVRPEDTGMMGDYEGYMKRLLS